MGGDPFGLLSKRRPTIRGACPRGSTVCLCTGEPGQIAEYILAYQAMTRGAWKDPEAESFKQEIQRIPAHRYGGLEDMAGVAVMLCSRAGSYFTGEVLNLDGGHRLRY